MERCSYSLPFSTPDRGDSPRSESGETVRDAFTDIAYAKLLLLIPAAITMTAVGVFQARGRTEAAQWLLLALLPLGACFHTGWHLQVAGRFLWLCAISIIGAIAALSTGFLFVQDAEPASIVAASLALGIGPLLTGSGTLIASFLLLKNNRQCGLVKPRRWRHFATVYRCSSLSSLLYFTRHPALSSSATCRAPKLQAPTAP